MRFELEKHQTFRLWVDAYIAWIRKSSRLRTDKLALFQFLHAYDILSRFQLVYSDDVEKVWTSVNDTITQVYRMMNPSMQELKRYIKVGFDSKGYMDPPSPPITTEWIPPM